MRELINIVIEADRVSAVNEWIAQYNITVAKIVEDGKTGIFYDSGNNPLAGIVLTINYLSAENNTPNPLMGMQVSNGRDTGVVVPSHDDKYTAMVQRKIMGQSAMANDIWVPKRYGKFVLPQNTFDKKTRVKWSRTGN